MAAQQPASETGDLKSHPDWDWMLISRIPGDITDLECELLSFYQSAVLESEDVYIQSGLQKDTQRKPVFVSLDLICRPKMTFPVNIMVLLQKILH